jgi:hypothetical protein
MLAVERRPTHIKENLNDHHHPPASPARADDANSLQDLLLMAAPALARSPVEVRAILKTWHAIAEQDRQ